MYMLLTNLFDTLLSQPLFESGALYGEGLFREGVVETATVVILAVIILSVISALGGQSTQRYGRRKLHSAPSESAFVDVPAGVSWALKRTVTPTKSEVNRTKNPQPLSWRLARKH